LGVVKIPVKAQTVFFAKRQEGQFMGCIRITKDDMAARDCFDNELQALLLTQYGLHLNTARKSSVGAGSDTWFLGCAEGKFVLKFPAASEINHPKLEPELCAFLRKNGIPACDFVKNRAGSCVCVDGSGRVFTLLRHLPGQTLKWNSAPETVLLESAELLGKIHCVLRNYPALPEGIGAGFFSNMTPQRALTSYTGTLWRPPSGWAIQKLRRSWNGASA